MKELKAYYHKKDGVLELGIDKQHIADFIVDGQDEWFQAKVGKKEYMFNFLEGKLGMYEANKTKENTYEVGEFINEIDVL